MARRFAGSGYSALAIDLLSARCGTGSFGDPAAALGRISSAEQVANMRSGLDELQRRAPGHKIAVVGICMGGGLVWQLLAAGEPQLAVACAFYGPLPENADFSGSKSVAVLGFYGDQDDRVTSTKNAVQAALDEAGLVNELIVEPGANHALFNDTGDRYNAVAAANAWKRLQGWFGEHLS